MPESAEHSRAAMLTYWSDGVYGYRWISLEKDPASLVARVAQELAEAAVPLVEHYAEAVNSAQLELLHEHWGEGDYPADGWGVEDVLDALKRVPRIAADEFKRTGAPSIKASGWYSQGFDFLNDSVFPRGDGVWVDFEGTLGQFLSDLLRFEAEGCKTIDRLTDEQAIWLGKVAALSRLSWADVPPPEQWRALHEAIEKFNQDHTEISSL
jgi:hypothetical protein